MPRSSVRPPWRRHGAKSRPIILVISRCAALSRQCLRRIAGSGGSVIVNVASILGKVTLPNLGSYCASKAALLRLSEGVRAELAGQGTRVVLVLPWAVDTPMSGPFPGEKTTPAEVATRTLDAIVAGDDDVWLHDYSLEVERRLRENPKELERELGSTFRSAP